MKSFKGITGILAFAMFGALATCSSSQTLQVLTAGSSAQFGPFAVAAWALATNGGQSAFHYTVKSGACPGTSCYAYLNDSRSVTVSGVKHTIPPEPGNLWVVWSTNGIWAYLSVDSTVGVRSFSAVPRATLALAALASLPVSTTTNFPYWSDGKPDTAMTAAVYNALTNTGKNTVALTAANTDIRPEDALFATNRALNTLGYGSVADPRTGHSGQFLIGNPIESHFSTAIANPVSFAIAGGADPFSGTVGPAEITIPIGAAPIVFVASTATGSTVAAASNITTANAAHLFSGTGTTPCAASLVTGATGAIDPVLREPLSGTMNTTQYTVFVPGGGDQETGVAPPTVGTTHNPLALPCGSGFRYRGVGTGDVVNNVVKTPNTLGYAFFSYESVGGGKTDRYLEYNGYDPLYSTTHTYTGALPTCPVVSGVYSCPVTPATGLSFPNLRAGHYTAWSVYRLITDAAHQTTAAALVAKAQALVNNNIPDFVPFTPVCATSASGLNDPGLDVYREHFVPSTIATIPDTITITPNDGSVGATVTCRTIRATLPALTLGGGVEAGGDVGGIIQGPFTANPPHPGPTEGQPH
jgi:ABC-type phosphate transport system substrate-binding protein